MAKPDDEVKRLLKQVFDHFDKEDQGPRQRQVRMWRKLKLLWDNLQYSYYSETAHDWRIPESTEMDDQSYYDRPINVFRAYLESIIAALSVQVPPIKCYPDDADNPLDLATAKAGDKIAQLIQRHNSVSLLWLHALFLFCTEGMIACYQYPKEDKEFGTYEELQYEDIQEQHELQVCPNCGNELSDRVLELGSENEPQELEPDLLDEETGEPGYFCPQCQELIQPVTERREVTSQQVSGKKTQAKSRVMQEVFGGLYVKVPMWARKQEDCLYLHYSYETHYANVIEKYEFLRDKLLGANHGKTSLEQVYRVSPQYRDSLPDNNVTVNYCWYRPSAFNILKEEDCEKLKKLYPDGVRIVVVEDEVADAEIQKLDKHWTLIYNPLSDYIHFDPLGLLLVSIQEITNDIVSLTLQTIEHGIGQTFFNPRYLDAEAYRNAEVIPGGMYPTIPLSTGKPISDGFFEIKTANLSPEVLPFAQKVQELGQLTSGALPSLFGGQLSGSRTASEYGMSRSQALQRLQNTWKMFLEWWKSIHTKAIPMYIAEVKEDERNVEKDKFGSFINVFIRKADLEGKIGRIEIEANENLPQSWNQIKDTIMQLMEINNPQILATLGSPDNLPEIRKAIGLVDFTIEGEDDRQKQYEEINELVNSTSISLPPNPMMMQQAMVMGMPPPPPQELPSVEIEPDVDNHQMHADICRRWLVSDAGRQARMDNIEGYKNVLLHLKMHKDIITQQMMQAAMNQSGAGMGSQPVEDPEKTPPIKENSDVRTEQ